MSAQASATTFIAHVDTASAEINASASFTGYEVVISGPNGGTTTTSLNLSLMGNLSATGTGEVALDVHATLHGSQAAVSAAGGLFAAEGQVFSQGLLAGFAGPSGNFTSGNFITPTIPVANGDHVLIDLSLAVNGVCNVDMSGDFGDAMAIYSDGFSFSRGGPVFNLPAGWTANSLDGSIVNNMFVPEPATGLLVMLGVLGLAASCRRLA